MEPARTICGRRLPRHPVAAAERLERQYPRQQRAQPERLAGDPRIMNAAMKAMNLGGSVKAELDKASRFAASVFGLATQEEVTALRSTIQNLEDTVAILESKRSAAAGAGQPPPAL